MPSCLAVSLVDYKTLIWSEYDKDDDVDDDCSDYNHDDHDYGHDDHSDSARIWVADVNMIPHPWTHVPSILTPEHGLPYMHRNLECVMYSSNI